MKWLNRIGHAALTSSWIWGALVSVAVYAALDQYGVWLNPFVLRCLSGRWEAYVCTSMFFVGLASLVIKAVDVALQGMLLPRMTFNAPVPGPQNSATLQVQLKQLDGQSAFWKRTYVHRWWHDALQAAQRKGENESPDDLMRRLADAATTRMHASYGLVRFLSWAIPAVGSLGTVLGIAAAVGQLAPDASADNMAGVTAGLGIAFDTMALALALSIILVFAKFLCEQQETQLLAAAEKRVERELTQRLGPVAAAGANQFDELRKLTQSVVEATEKLAQQQTKLWESGLQQTNERWTDEAAAIGDQLETIVSRAVAKAVSGQRSGTLTVAAGGGGQLSDMGQVQEALEKIAAFFAHQHAENIQESEVFMQLADAIREETSGAAPKKRPQPRQKSNGGDSIVGLWDSLAG